MSCLVALGDRAFFKKKKKWEMVGGVDLGEKGSVGIWEEWRKEETVVRMYCMRKE